VSAETSFDVAILAGGRSSRMGRDKALLVVDGTTLLERQIELAWSLGPREVWVVGRPQGELGPLTARGIVDAQPGQGPLGGLATVLAATTADHVLLLAVDLPALTREFLERVLAARIRSAAVVPRSAHGWEPTVAVYPRSFAAMAQAALDAGRRAIHELIAKWEEKGFLRSLPIAAEDGPILVNWNSPADLPVTNRPGT